jgi:hypothetical protein
MVTCHHESKKAVTWNIKNKTVGNHVLRSTSPKKGFVKVIVLPLIVIYE